MIPCFSSVISCRLISSTHINHFKNSFNKAVIDMDSSNLKIANRDYLGLFTGQSKLILKPKTTQDVSEILKYCNKNQISVVPQGGNTSLVGGSVPMNDEIILNLSRMNTIYSIDQLNGSLICGAGCTLGVLEHELDKHELILPYDLGAKGSQIGGNVATNAGGLRLLRYGSLRGAVTGLEVVLGDGTIIDNIHTLRKNNTGLPLFQNFIGSEGILGIITKVAILTPPKPKSQNLAFFGVDSFDNVIGCLETAKEMLSETLSAFEFLDQKSFEYSIDHLPNQIPPLSEKHPFYVLVETHGSSQEHDQDKLGAYIEKILGTQAQDGVIAQSIKQFQDLWLLRESVPEGMRVLGKVYKYDVSLAHKHYYEIIQVLKKRLSKYIEEDGVVVIGYGHVGDSNIHVNVAIPSQVPDEKQIEIKSQLDPFVLEWVALHNGSVSAEHGIGQSKVKYLSLNQSPESIQLMQKVKKVFDPNGIMNPGKVLPSL